MIETPLIDTEKCTGCGLCVGVCSCGALILIGNVITFTVTAEECDWCADCEMVCPTEALSCPFEIVIEEL